MLRKDAAALDAPPTARQGRELFVRSISEECRAMEYLREYYRGRDVDHLASGNAALGESDILYQRFIDETEDLMAGCPGF
ncbi:MAG: hypothetical protein ACYC5M_17300 [Anaerolineae bacterium]